jgi:serine/threonine-protein phosphatase 4 catalytic subunit
LRSALVRSRRYFRAHVDSVDGWATSNRGAGYLFGKDPVDQFNKINGVSLICRAHQLVMEGYKYMFGEKLATVWSAPNYYYKCGNVASILELDENLQRYYKIFEAAPLENKLQGARKVPSYFL